MEEKKRIFELDQSIHIGKRIYHDNGEQYSGRTTAACGRHPNKALAIFVTRSCEKNHKQGTLHQAQQNKAVANAQVYSITTLLIYWNNILPL